MKYIFLFLPFFAFGQDYSIVARYSYKETGISDTIPVVLLVSKKCDQCPIKTMYAWSVRKQFRFFGDTMGMPYPDQMRHVEYIRGNMTGWEPLDSELIIWMSKEDK